MNTKKIIVYGLLAVLLTLAGCDTGIEDITKSSLTGNVTLDNNSPKVGESITATYAPGNGAGAQTWQWFRVGTGTEDLIQNAAANTYTTTTADEGKKIKVQLSFDDRSGSLSAITTNTVTAAANNDITYTVAQTGGVDGVTDSTGIIFTFSASVDSLNLTADDITIGGTAAKGTTELTGTGTTRTLAITVNSAGTATVSINKTGIEAETKHVTVYKEGESAPTLTSITAVYTGTAAIYPTTPLNNLKAGLTVKAQYSNGSENTLSEHEYNLDGTLTVGTSTITVSYTDSNGVTKTTTFTVTVTAAPAKTLTGITLNTASVKKNYDQNEQLDLAGLEVTANYSDSSSETVTDYTSNPADGATLSTSGQITVTVSYTEGTIIETASFIVNVNTGTPGLAYELITTGTNANTYRVRKGSVNSGEVIIPATYNGLPVTEIDNDAFSGCTSITSIEIPASVTSIGNSAFAGGFWYEYRAEDRMAISTVTFAAGSQLTTIGSSAFAGCSSLTSINIPASVTSIGQGAFNIWTSSQTIYVEGYAIQTTADAAWGSSWRSGCGAVITYLGQVSMSKITITRQPDKTVYRTGDQLDITGLEVTAAYNNDTTEIVTITAADITGFNSAITGDKTLTVTYQGKTTTFIVTVISLSSDIILVSTTAEWNAALSTISNGGNNQSYTVYVSSNVGVAGSTADSFGTVSGLTVTLQGSGTLSLPYPNKGSIIRVGANQILIIDSTDLTLQGEINNNAPLVYVGGTNARLELKNGTIRDNGNNIYGSNATFSSYGCGVYIAANGSFIMSGGVISDNTAQGRTNGDYYSGNSYGGGVYVAADGNFIMTGGTISGNKSYASGYYAYAYGGGVYVAVNGNFTMSDGVISGNTVETFGTNQNTTERLYGGGVYVDGTFTMNGGAISGNICTPYFEYGLPANCYGGGVYVNSGGTFHIVNGTIYGSDEANEDLRNILTGFNPSGAALYNNSGTAQHGTFSGPTWNSAGTLSTTDNTIRVVNGGLQQ